MFLFLKTENKFMKVVQIYDESKEEKFAAEIFKKILMSFIYDWKIERIEIHLSSKDSVELVGDTGKIYINRDNFFIRSMDDLGIGSIFLERVMELILLINGIGLTYSSRIQKLTKDFLIDRLLIRRFDGFIFHKNLSRLLAIKLETKDEWLEANLLCEVFYKYDDWARQYLRAIVNKKKTKGSEDITNKINMILDKFDESIKTESDFIKAMKEIEAIYNSISN